MSPTRSPRSTSAAARIVASFLAPAAVCVFFLFAPHPWRAAEAQPAPPASAGSGTRAPGKSAPGSKSAAGSAAAGRSAATPAADAASHRGAIRFVEVARQAGIGVVQIGGSPSMDYLIESMGSGAAWLDYDNDGDLDLYLAEGATLQKPVGPPDRLYRNNGDGTFTDVTTAAGLGDTRWSFGVTVADFDNDGDPDIYLTNWGKNRLYRNNGNGTFTDVAQAAGVANDSWGTSAAWADIDRDGDLDLYVTDYLVFDTKRVPARGTPAARELNCIWKTEVVCGPRGLEPAPDVLYVNMGDTDGDGVPNFVNATSRAGLAVGPYYGLAVIFFDADDDGDPDLYVANDSQQNTFFRNRGDGTFEEDAIATGLAFNELGEEQASMGIASGDYDRDGRLDLAVTSFSHDHDTLYRSSGNGFFDDVSYAAGIGVPTWYPLAWGIGFADLDSDGWEDLFIANGHVYPQVDALKIGSTFRERNGLFRNLGDGTFADVAGQAGPGLAVKEVSRAAAFGDYDGDGDVDILVTNLNGVPSLLRNDTPREGRHWLALKLEGTRSNRDGIGSRVTLVSGGKKQVREMRINYSYLASNEPYVRFGLGLADDAERIEVRWPRGGMTVLENVKGDQVLRIKEPASPPPAGR